MPDNFQVRLEEQFLIALRHHILGLRAKVESDFSKASFDRELGDLQADPIYPKFALDSAEYVLVRFMGRMSISIGRRLGEIYDKIPRFLAAARFGLTPSQIAPKFEGLELDICLLSSDLSREDRSHVEEVVASNPTLRKCPLFTSCRGIGIEIRYNFNPNDSARLRKDVSMANHLKDANLLPVYLIFSAISPREEAIARLQRAGWTFIIGEAAVSFAQSLLGLDLAEILDRPKIKAEVKKDIAEVMKAMIDSYAFQKAIGTTVRITPSTHTL